MKNEYDEYKVPEKYITFCNEVAEEIKNRYEENGINVEVRSYDTEVFIKTTDKSGFYKSIASLEDIDITKSIEYNVNNLVKRAVANFMNENFD